MTSPRPQLLQDVYRATEGETRAIQRAQTFTIHGRVPRMACAHEHGENRFTLSAGLARLPLSSELGRSRNAPPDESLN
jgi:hypothetical protein